MARAARSPQWTEFQATKIFGSLDGLRAISIIGVVWHHAARSQPLPLAAEGAMGVPLFFAISGFLITTLLLREREGTGDISLKGFYVRRSLRIFPLYYTIILVYLAATTVFDRGTPAVAEFHRNLPYFLTYTSNWFVHLEGRVVFYFAWSLATEEQFYLTWPSLEKWLPRHWPGGIALAIVLLWWLVSTNTVELEQGSLLRTVITSIAPAICFGVALAHLLHVKSTFDTIAWLLGRRWLSPLLLVAVVLVLVLRAPVVVQNLCMALLVAACVVREDHFLAPFLKLKPMVSIGQTSYGIYLMHMLMLNAVERALGALGVATRLVVFPATVLAAWGIAWVSWRYYEARFLKLKKHFAPRNSSTARAPALRGA